jgi:hypothetical protein
MEPRFGFQYASSAYRGRTANLLDRRMGKRRKFLLWQRIYRGCGPAFPSLHGRYATSTLSGRRRRARALTSVRRANCTYGFPVCSFHEDGDLAEANEGINPTRLTSPYSPYSLVRGRDFQPAFRHRLNRCDQIRRTIQPSSR